MAAVSATLLGALLAAESAAQVHKVQPSKIFCAYVTAKDFKPFSAKVWDKRRWQRKRVKPDTIRAQRWKLQCAAGPGHRKAIRRTWRRDKHAFKRYQKRKFKEQRERAERLKYLPYDCGNGVRSAIPCETMLCESGGSYAVINPDSGARGKYQFLPSTYELWCKTCDWSPPDQDQAAFRLYESSGGGPWVCAG